MSDHLVLGAGPIGTGVALRLAGAGERVRIVTRRGGGPDHPLVERVAADATDARRLVRLARGVTAVYHAANPPSYAQWDAVLPPLQTAVIEAARENDAVLALTAGLYAYGRQPDGRMTEDSPMTATTRKGLLRRRMWEQARASGVRVLEVRGADYIGREAAGIYSLVLGPALERGRAALVPGALDQPHTFTYTGDVAAALVALAGDERAWGRAWHVPSAPPVTLRDLADRFADASGRPRPRLVPLPRITMRAAGVLSRDARELAEMDYQWYEPFRMEAPRTREVFGLTATDLDVAIRDQVGAAVGA